ncbi:MULTISPECIES: hypothetical protein [unclassified Streptomyces]|uniref:hypothetical protein n=1 Tax=unclassified Streptomyces TaxID=2593676 RepID=UPI002366F229|nr:MULTISPECIES: hypothetical protein [unclassified Streptomyces]MDF3147503.1 hypothetical protein [Streptomyces sp. T21Q-yed]WDF43331.1 hypothetical protein PBV52_44360 [Streptomyces sp. T12]
MLLGDVSLGGLPLPFFTLCLILCGGGLLRQLRTAALRGILRVLQSDRAAVRALPLDAAFRETMKRAVALFTDPEASPPNPLRSTTAVLMLHTTVSASDGIEAAPEGKQAASLAVALGLPASAQPSD